MDASCSVTLGRALPLPQCPNLLLQRDVTAQGLVPDAAAGGGGTAVDEGWGQGALGSQEMSPQSPGSAFGHRVPPGTAGLSEGRHCSGQTLSPGSSSQPGPCPSESLVARNPREHPRTCSPPTSPATGLPVPAARCGAWAPCHHLLPCPAQCRVLLHPADPSLEVTAARLAGRHGHLEGPSAPLSLGSTWAQFPVLAGSWGQDVEGKELS